ncbi:MAG: hypothetical protein H0W87_00740 [Actinobacteria bacterium]|nr:hypothetical protein [Actinomycetota bacterium]
MHGRLVLVAALLLTSGCAASKTVPEKVAPQHGASSSLRALAKGPGHEVALVAGASDFTTGEVRYPFLVVDDNGGSVARPHARVWLARGLDQKPFERRTAVLEQVGVPGRGHGDVSHLYVVHLRVATPGKYWVLAKPDGGRPIQGLGNLIVRRSSFSPAIGSKAFPSQTPTLESVHGDAAKVTTRLPPDRALLRYSVAESLAARKAFVLVFATPKFCTSRTCGPVVDVVDAVRHRFARTDIRFIHVEIYKNNDPSKGFNQWVREWHLPTEPWVILVGSDRQIKAKFEGSVSVRELQDAVARYLR